MPRHLGQGLAAVPRLRRLPAAGREVRRTQARAGPAPGDQPEQRPVPGRAFAAAGRAVGHRHPPGQGQRAARCHPHRVRAENHPAGCGYIKIDHSFVGRVNADPESTRILDCVLDLARKLSISIVAEGVETKEQLDYLNQNNITFQQGYYFYKPVTYIDLVKIILSKPKVKVVVE